MSATRQPARQPEAKPLWASVNDEALLTSANLARVLAGMGFSARIATTTRGAIVWWPADYLRPSAKCPGHRASCAVTNRRIRDADVLLMLDPPDRLFAVDTYSGEWRAPDGAQRGADIISLGMLRWSCKFGQAANRIARLIGMRDIPTVTHGA